MIKKIKDSVEFLKTKGFSSCDIIIVLGTGLSSIIDDMEIVRQIAYEDIPDFPVSTVESHSSNLLECRMHNKKINILSGRFHYYEGYDFGKIVFPLRVLMHLGCKMLILSNAAGGVNHDYRNGDVMLIEDHINLMAGNPLRGANIEELGERFPLMKDAYSLKHRKHIKNIAAKLNIDIDSGVYLALQGPSLETNAEYNMARIIGGDAVGMSTVPEVIAARHMNIDVLGFSIITNINNDENRDDASHDSVIENAKMAGVKLRTILNKFIEEVNL